ncbi:MAG: hypothetical protein KatS3mg093_222 [Candidatus Parcubacteria bacterium]|nr:MAG: hypothetical protein KatS3mg093_222 [Candidatus Parcubacteria bacterium]
MNNNFDLQFILGSFFGLYNLIKWIFIILDLILLFGFIFSFYKALEFRPRIQIKPKARQKAVSLRKEIYREKWFDITTKFEINTPSARKMALIEADNLINEILKEIGIKGKTMADRLSKIHPESLESLKNLWEAHHIRNDLVHSPDFELSESEAKKVLGYYEKFLKEIGVIIE